MPALTCFLVEDGVDRDRGLAGLAVADDQLALAAADRHQRVDRLEPGLHRLVHRFARDDARRLDLDPRAGDVGQRPLAVDRVAEPVDHPAEQAAADRHVDDRAGALDRVALADAAVVAKDHDADIVAFEIEGHALHPVRELDHLAGLDLVEAVDAGDAVADRQHLADLGDIGLAAETGDLLLQDRGDFRRANFHDNPLSQCPSAGPSRLSRKRCSLLLSDPSTMREPTLTIMPPSRPDRPGHRPRPGRRRTRRKLLAQRGVLRFGQRLRRGDLGGDLAAPLGELGEIGLDHRRHREEAPVARDDAEEIARSAATARPARPAPRSPCPARRATAPGCAPAAPDRRCRCSIARNSRRSPATASSAWRSSASSNSAAA